MRAFVTGSALLLLAAIMALGSEPTTTAEEPLLPHVPGEVVLRLADGATIESVGIDYSLVRDDSFAGYVTVAVPEGSELEAIETLSERPGIASAELNLISQPSFVPTDPDYPQQWSMPMIGLETAWDQTQGEGVIIAVLDTGVAFEDYGNFGQAPDLAQTTFVDPWDATTGTEHPNDANGHGTHVTGTLAQSTDNGIGTAGIAPAALIMPVKVCASYGCSSDDMAEGVTWAVDHGADIISMSVGGPGLSAVERAAYAYAEEQNVLVVAAAGNGGADFVGDPELDYPAAVKTVVAVGALDIQKKRTRYSNWGVGEGAPQHVHVMAPGGNLHADLDDDGNPDGILQSTYAHSCGSGETDYHVFTSCYYHGTSMATPHVSGTAALVLSAFPNLTAAQLRQVLACSAQDLGPIGTDNEYGSGMVRPDKALINDDHDQLPDCIEPPGQVTAFVGDASVLPGKTVGIKVWLAIAGDGVDRFSVSVTYDRALFRVRNCESRPDVSCTINVNKITFNSFPTQKPIVGAFRIGEITFQAIGDVDTSATLDGNATTQPFYKSHPKPVVVADDGLLVIREVPPALPGDSDCDGIIGTRDVVTTLTNAGGLDESFCAMYGDTNCSKDVDLTDVLTLLNYLARIGPALPTGCPVS